MATLKTQYENYLKNNNLTDNHVSYDYWLNAVLKSKLEPVVSDDFQIGPEGAYEHTDTVAPAMHLQTFCKLVETLKLNYEHSNQLYKLGVDLTEICDPLHSVISMLLKCIYGEECVDVFDWWCYEKDWGTRADITLTDRDGNKLCETIEELHNYMEENKSADYVYTEKVPMTDEQRIELLRRFHL